MLKLKYFIYLIVMSILLLFILYVPKPDLSNPYRYETLARTDSIYISLDSVMNEDTIMRVGSVLPDTNASDSITIDRMMLSPAKRSSQTVHSTYESVESSTDNEFDYKEFTTWILGILNGFFGMLLVVKKLFFEKSSK